MFICSFSMLKAFKIQHSAVFKLENFCNWSLQCHFYLQIKGFKNCRIQGDYCWDFCFSWLWWQWPRILTFLREESFSLHCLHLSSKVKIIFDFLFIEFLQFSFIFTYRLSFISGVSFRSITNSHSIEKKLGK